MSIFLPNYVILRHLAKKKFFQKIFKKPFLAILSMKEASNRFSTFIESCSAWSILPKRVFWKFFEKSFFSPNVLKWHNSARKWKKINKKKSTLPTEVNWTLRKFLACLKRFFSYNSITCGRILDFSSSVPPKSTMLNNFYKRTIQIWGLLHPQNHQKRFKKIQNVF